MNNPVLEALKALVYACRIDHLPVSSSLLAECEEVIAEADKDSGQTVIIPPAKPHKPGPDERRRMKFKKLLDGEK